MLGYENGMKVKGGGTVVPMWHGVAVLLLWFDTVGILWGMCLGYFCGFVFGGWKLGQEGSLSSDTT